MGRGYCQRRSNPRFSDGNNADGDDEDGDYMEVNRIELVEIIDGKK